jgi:serine/threonine-protein kinase
MATVFLAHDRAGGPVALKLLHPELGSTVGADRFRREIRVAAQLRHPNILTVLDSGVAAVPVGGGTVDFLWFTMPYVEGQNVWERFEREGVLGADEVIRIGRAVAEALGFAHQQGVVHRDIKPDNIMLEGERVLVADFGVARAVSEVQEKLTATGVVVGTPTYMSPEQASGDRAGWAKRCLRPRLRALRATLRHATVPRGHTPGHPHAAVHRSAASASPRGADAGDSRSRDPARARAGPGRALRDGG